MLLLDDTVEGSEGAEIMVTVDCPWCDGPMALEADADDASCDGCSIRVELAPDRLPVITARAA
jgi:hypothetical protein